MVRLRVGEQLDLVDGTGGRAHCVVVAAGKDRLSCEVRSRDQEPLREPRLVLAQALPKGDRGELAVELATEAGVDEIVPWSAERCVSRWAGDRAERGVTRWRDAARAAAKQSRRAWLPVVAPLTGIAGVAARCSEGLGLVLDAAAPESLVEVPLPSTGPVLVVVGPEGGLSDGELAALAAAGARPVRLGPEVVRTSTAGALALAVLSSRTGRW